MGDVNVAHDTHDAWLAGTVLVGGASSQIGYFLLPELVRTGAHVLALSRNPQPDIAGVAWLQGAWPSPPAAAEATTSVCSFAPLEALAAWIDAGGAPHLRRVVATSSMSAESKHASPIAAERAVSRRLREGEAALVRACAARGIAWTIFRPTLIYGAARDRSLTPLAHHAMRWHVFGLPAGSGLRQPVHAADIATAVLYALDDGAKGKIVQIGGGERLTAAAMFERVRASLPVRTIPLRIPDLLVRVGARVPTPLRGPLARLEQDLVADNSELERLLDVHPRAFKPDRTSWGL